MAINLLLAQPPLLREYCHSLVMQYVATGHEGGLSGPSKVASMVLLYSSGRDHEGFELFFVENTGQKLASQYLHGTLARLGSTG